MKGTEIILRSLIFNIFISEVIMKNSVNSVNHQAQTNSSLLYATPVYPLPPHRGQYRETPL